MDSLISIGSFLVANQAAIMGSVIAILASLLTLSEVLALIPSVAANSVFQLVQGFLKRFKKP